MTKQKLKCVWCGGDHPNCENPFKAGLAQLGEVMRQKPKDDLDGCCCIGESDICMCGFEWQELFRFEEKTPRKKYLNDPYYHALVDSLVSLIHKCHMPPSEVREAAVLACILYEETTGFKASLQGDVDAHNR